MNDAKLILDIHPKYGFYERNENGLKCDFMDLEGYHVRCNRDFGAFKKGKKYVVYDNTNDEIIVQKDALRTQKELDKYDLLYGSMDYVPVERFEDGTFTLESKK